MPLFDTPFLYPERGQKRTFFDPLPPSFRVVIECPIRIIRKDWDINEVHEGLRVLGLHELNGVYLGLTGSTRLKKPRGSKT